MNTRILLKARPKAQVTDDCFTSDTQSIPEVGDGQVLVRNIYMSVDPYMRGRMNDVKSYVPPFQIGEPLQAGVVGQVEASNNPDYAKGDYVTGMLNWENYTLTNGNDVSGSPLRKLDKNQAPLSYHLGILGMPGMTAWVGTKVLGQCKEGDNVFVTAASGAVGSTVGQIAKLLGGRVVGSAGGPEKCAFLTDELGFDGAIDYKNTENPIKDVAMAFPDGINVHFENTGGPMFEAAILNMAPFGRISLCGMINDYDKAFKDMAPGPRGMAVMVGRSVRMQGFIVFNYPEECKEWIMTASKWLAEGKLKYKETVVEGIENAPSAFMGLLSGKNFGKMIVKIGEEE
jgi:hypothetical protein